MPSLGTQRRSAQLVAPAPRSPSVFFTRSIAVCRSRRMRPLVPSASLATSFSVASLDSLDALGTGTRTTPPSALGFKLRLAPRIASAMEGAICVADGCSPAAGGGVRVCAEHRRRAAPPWAALASSRAATHRCVEGTDDHQCRVLERYLRHRREGLSLPVRLYHDVVKHVCSSSRVAAAAAATARRDATAAPRTSARGHGPWYQRAPRPLLTWARSGTAQLGEFAAEGVHVARHGRLQVGRIRCIRGGVVAGS